MEVELNPRKRKQAPNAAPGRSTRSKSLFYSHRNRSGRFRHVQNGASFADGKELKCSNPAAGGDVEVEPSPVKDLRSRRVFSRPLVVGEQEPKKPALDEGDEQIDSEMRFSRADLAEVRSLEEDVETRACGDINGKLGFQKVKGSPPNRQELGDLSPILSSEEGGKCSSNLISASDLECEQIVDEENVQTTPPDPDIIAQQKSSSSKSEQDVSQRNHGSPRMPSICRKNDSALRRKLVLNPCARMKVFRAPSSISYRRLLPYLMDIAKDKSCEFEVNSQVPLAKDSVRVMSDFEGETSLKKIESDGCEVGKSTSPGDYVNQMPSTNTTMNSSANIMSPTLADPDGQIKVPSPSNSPQKDSPRVDQVFSPKSRDNEMILSPCARLKVFRDPSSVSYRRLLPYLMNVAKDKSCAIEIKSDPKIEIVLEEKPAQMLQVPLTKDSLMVKSDFDDTLANESDASNVAKEAQPGDSIDSDSQIEDPSQNNSPQGDSGSVDLVSSPKSGETNTVLDNISPMDADVDQDCKVEANAIAVLQSSPPFKASTISEVSNAGASRGILRKNPRGCRGLCTCLNCASFRLHAERAFEFSKNQMHDTEEIVLGLTDELSRLRKVLEKSLGDSNCQARLIINQVKEVCEKASKAEETARVRLNEMSEDLFVHCRTKSLQRPRVKFAIDEENVSNSTSPSSR